MGISVLNFRVTHKSFLKPGQWLCPLAVGGQLSLNTTKIGLYWLHAFQQHFFFNFFFRAAPAVYGSSQARVQSELQLLAYIIVTATSDLNCICDLHCRSR